MTETQGTESQLDQVLAGALTYRLAHPDATINDLAAQVVPVAAPEPVAEATPFPALPAQADLTAHQHRSLVRFPQVFGSVTMKTRRQLTSAELVRLMEELQTIEEVGKMAAARRGVISELARTSMDVRAEKEGRAFAKDEPGHPATPRDQNGHYLLAAPEKPERLSAGELAWSQEYAKGGALPAGSLLAEAARTGVVSREEMLGFTRAERVLDAEKASAFIRKNPARGLQILRAITQRTAPTSRLNVRKAN